MSLRRFRPGLIVVALGTLVAAWCVASAPPAGADPVLAIEIAGGAVVSIWTLVGARSLWRSRGLSRALEERCADDSLAGVQCRIVLGGGRQAFVLGAVRPRIYIGDQLLESLDDEELRAVLLHEEHHRRTRGPLRAAALGAWLALLGQVAPIRAALIERLTDLEEEADADALHRGASASALAGALLKADPRIAPGASFAGQADQRLRTLLALAGGARETEPPALPYEWLPVAALAVIVIACHLTGLSHFA